MIDSGTMMRLMLGLIGAVYLLLAYISVRDTGPSPVIVPTIVAVAIVVSVWVFAPGFLEAGMFRLPFIVRQAGLAAGGAAVIVHYVAVRRSSRGQPGGVFVVIGVPLLGISLALVSANWLVAGAAAVLVGTDAVRRAGASGDGGSEQSPHQQDTR